MKLKVIPEDFVVKELAHLPLKPLGPYRLYLLEKKGWNTVDLLLRIARKYNLPYRLFSYGGKKDRHAHTFQYVSVKYPADLTTVDKNFSLKAIGYMDRPMGPDLIKGNAFTITLRALDNEELSRLSHQVDEVKEFGYPNYFDDQRFGSLDRERGFLAERLLKKHYKGALEIYLTAIYKEEKREAKQRKRFFRQHWGDWDACLLHAKTAMEKKIFSLLTQKPKAFLEALRMIPGEELSLFFAAYQSFLWNELLRRILRELRLDLTAVPGVAGPYLFYRRLDTNILLYLKSLELPLAAKRMEFPDAQSERLFIGILEEKGLKPSHFNLSKLRQAFFKSTPREAIVIPHDLKVDPPEADELYPGKQKIRLSFRLPRGSYGTMLIKRLTMPEH
ncbi:tRNA pseudouridine13 synthase [Thermanaeromonas toyohensis ToBE]|uniref:tRNA pseudouridine13 synthase n=1 Tax=Thermanaeromonas toyohensis ToBE TaxID=698762 RepID=A0A1W1VJI6_9FIRM|nr:tRNA pseudouridine(13) synthase TruD [Thermanaeromonas toyohensis]SMB93488.1 tRNA pseudouridine13 synthase [Thermanaeromonas toyohensis ToBE]